MSLEDEVRRRAEEIHRQNTQKVVELVNKDKDLRNLHQVLDPQTAEIYRRVLPRHAELAELDQSRGLNPAEQAELAVGYASLYPTFGDEGIMQVAAAWISTRPDRQARGN